MQSFIISKAKALVLVPNREKIYLFDNDGNFSLNNTHQMQARFTVAFTVTIDSQAYNLGLLIKLHLKSQY